MRIALLTIIMICLIVTPALAFDITLGTDYDVASESFLVITEASQDWQALTFGATIEENLSDLLDKNQALDTVMVWAEM